jgi:succinate dehydrogenase / fumarate reductase cytochrome b subunit
MAATATTRPRPTSPHLSQWRWRMNMIVSILHRITGHALALGAVPLLLWWLWALASGPAAYDRWLAVAKGPLGYVAGVAVTWLALQHAANGIRHLVMDAGAGFDPAHARATASATLVFSLVLTLLIWAFIIWGRA